MTTTGTKGLTCCQRGCKETVAANGWNVPCCLSCGKEYPKCEKHGGQAAGRRSLRSHKGLCIGRVRDQWASAFGIKVSR
jgi:hypothetical protein